ncbi:MAG TPA: hypothetical protein DHV14_09770 [Micrococcales bacterium]|uniref:ESAT-6-like protein n=1 Tax=Miniimonas arenae TaxID=676201 RepID=A0A5C5BG02_9MICO|nr:MULTISPECIES: WXG100 family type VII secretion target [Miniimonas]TNU76284.1 WXG100 family type VII secretion target [Miniimonas arenae]HCX85400.1 hypothetical protein [Micrococcales bacterium]
MNQQRIAMGFGSVAQAASDMAATASRIQQRLEDLTTEVTRYRTGWGGSASEAFDAAQRQWNAAFVEMNGVLSSTGTAVDQGGQDFQAAEARNRARFE